MSDLALRYLDFSGLILSGSAIKSDFVTPAAQMLCEKALI